LCRYFLESKRGCRARVSQSRMPRHSLDCSLAPRIGKRWGTPATYDGVCDDRNLIYNMGIQWGGGKTSFHFEDLFSLYVIQIGNPRRG
jgi:hypothetical protein